MRVMLVVIMGLVVPLSPVAAQQSDAGAVSVGGMNPVAAGGLPWNGVRHAGVVPDGDAVLRLPAVQEDTGRTWSITGAIVGAVVGAAVGGAIGCMANRDDYGVFCGGQSDTKVVIGAVLGAGAGAWIGAVLPGRLR